VPALRLIVRATGMLLGFLACVPLHYLSLLILRRSGWPRRFLAWTAFAAGIEVSVEGRPLDHHVLFASNHISWVDILLLGGSAGAAFVSKEEVARWPVIGWLAKLNRTVFVARAERGAVRDQADALRNALARGQPVALFPEGTVSPDGQVLAFRASLFASLYPPLPGVKVQPIAIDYGAAAADLAWLDGETILANATRLLSRRGSLPVTLRFLEPVDPVAAGDRKALASRSREEIVEALAGGASGAEPLPLYGRR
jgi:1-acyl-sn-glycerol-3-phosphate acyltransferase